MARREQRPPCIGEAFPFVLAAAQSGGSSAFERLYRAFAPSVVGYARMQGAADSDGLTNEVFLNVFNAVGSFTGDEGQFRSWVFTIAHHRLVDERRARGRRPVDPVDGYVLEEAASHGDVEADAIERLTAAEARGLLDALSPDQRDVLLLRILGGLTVDEVADAIGKRPGAVKALQRRALASLQRLAVGASL